MSSSLRKKRNDCGQFVFFYYVREEFSSLSSTGLCFGSVTSNLPIGLSVSSKFPKLSVSWECPVHTQLFRRGFGVREFVVLVTGVCRAFSRADLLWHMHWPLGRRLQCSEVSHTGAGDWPNATWQRFTEEYRGGNCCVQVPTVKGIAIPMLANGFQ